MFAGANVKAIAIYVPLDEYEYYQRYARIFHKLDILEDDSIASLMRLATRAVIKQTTQMAETLRMPKHPAMASLQRRRFS